MRTVPLSRTCNDLLADAGRALGTAIRQEGPAERFAAAHLSALRGAAAVLAARARPRSRVQRSTWDLLPEVAPALGEWAAYFASTARRRQAIDAGIVHGVSRREADDMVRQSAQFLDLVDRFLATN